MQHWKHLRKYKLWVYVLAPVKKNGMIVATCDGGAMEIDVHVSWHKTAWQPNS
jgi:hypothetical protein